MKHIKLSLRKMMVITLSFMFLLSNAQIESQPSVAVLGIDSKKVIQDQESISFMLRLEIEKTNTLIVMDKYEVAELLSKNGVDLKNCFSKTCVLNAGKILNVDKVITGSVERFGEKIIIILKLMDVKTEKIERQDATEYINLQNELQKMLKLSIQKLLNLPVDQMLVSQLVNYDAPIESPQTQVKLDGPRMGASMTFGDAAKVLKAPESKGGYDMYPLNFVLGWQFEKQYISAGNFRALVEFIPSVGALESGRIIPNFTFLNGFRFGKAGWEFAFGPNFKIVKKAKGFFDKNNDMGGGKDEWYLEEDWKLQKENPNNIETRLDSRGYPYFSTGLFIGAGRTFKSGYLNIPVNIYVIPRKEGTIAGFSFGFNIYKKPKSK
ncbi:MAG: hypothetical protein HUU47_07550 [Bacteroidetes bacterium]|nr:hypothetical protein [Bacteroidota bacterium]